MQAAHKDLLVVGLTESADLAAIGAFLTQAEGAYPVLYGLSATTKDAYGVTKAPSLRVVDGAGVRAGDDMAALERLVAR